MRAISSLFTVLASIATIAAMTVRIWWSKPRPTPQDWMPDDPPKAPRWLRVASKWWLIVVAAIVGLGFVTFAIITIVNLST